MPAHKDTQNCTAWWGGRDLSWRCSWGRACQPTASSMAQTPQLWYHGPVPPPAPLAPGLFFFLEARQGPLAIGGRTPHILHPVRTGAQL